LPTADGFADAASAASGSAAAGMSAGSADARPRRLCTGADCVCCTPVAAVAGARGTSLLAGLRLPGPDTSAQLLQSRVLCYWLSLFSVLLSGW
jgi:hypothetical protein